MQWAAGAHSSCASVELPSCSSCAENSHVWLLFSQVMKLLSVLRTVVQAGKELSAPTSSWKSLVSL
jgi:hypothetical protein